MPQIPARKPFNLAAQLAANVHRAVYNWLAPRPITEPLDAAVTHWTATRLIENLSAADIHLIDAFIIDVQSSADHADRINLVTAYLKGYFDLDIGDDCNALNLRSGIPSTVRPVLRKLVQDLRYLTHSEVV